MIVIKPSATADTRTCDFATVSKETLLESSYQHIADVRKALQFFMERIAQAGVAHDTDKIVNITGFHADFVTGFSVTTWWDAHRKLNRHHLFQDDGVPTDVNLIDVLDCIADGVMAGLGRSGSVYPIVMPPGLLERAVQNTVELLTAQVRVEDQRPCRFRIVHEPEGVIECGAPQFGSRHEGAPDGSMWAGVRHAYQPTVAP